MTFLPVAPEYPDEREIPNKFRLRYLIAIDKHIIVAEDFPDFRIDGVWFGPLMETVDHEFSVFMSRKLGCHITYLTDVAARPVTILNPTFWVFRGWPRRKRQDASDHLWTNG